jgi:hypothetical protein
MPSASSSLTLVIEQERDSSDQFGRLRIGDAVNGLIRKSLGANWYAWGKGREARMSLGRTSSSMP